MPHNMVIYRKQRCNSDDPGWEAGELQLQRGRGAGGHAVWEHRERADHRLWV